MSEFENIEVLQLFMTETSGENEQIRIQSMNKVATVALVLGKEKTRTELFPYLETLMEQMYGDDEVLLHLADQLGQFVPLVGGTDHIHLILDALEKLMCVEEAVVTEKAVDSLQTIAEALDSELLERHYVPLIKKMAESEWFTSKCSTTGLFTCCYPKVSDESKLTLRNVFRILGMDDSPLVRRAAATRLVDFCKIVDIAHLITDFVPMFEHFAKDDQDSVKVLAVDVGISIAIRLKKDEVETYVWSALLDLFGDPSWRVRYQVSSQINSIQLAIGSELTRNYLLPVFQNLALDNEPQVREACARNIVLFCQVLQSTYFETAEGAEEPLDPIIIDQILPIVRQLDQDPNTEVKEALSNVITSFSPLLGPDKTRNLLLPIITSSLINDSSKVRENIIKNLNSIIKIIGLSDIGDTVLSIVVDLVNNSNSVWRTRRNLLVTINFLAKYSGQEYFDENLKILYEKLLNDGVYAVRKTAPIILPILVKNFGVQWAMNSIIPDVLKMAEHTHYLFRFVCLFCIDELVTPTLDLETANYLNSDDTQCPTALKYLDQLHQAPNETEKAPEFLKNLQNLNNALKENLKQSWVQETLRWLYDNDVVDDDIKRYAEDTIDIFLADNDSSITGVNQRELEQEESYLHGLLNLLNNDFLDVIHKLSRDKVPNVQIRAVKTLEKIINFNAALERELATLIISPENVEEDLEMETDIDQKQELVNDDSDKAVQNEVINPETNIQDIEDKEAKKNATKNLTLK